ncbi:hypothetical protein BH24ACT19_BH24ACT19_06810 [soil metagenome]
MAESVKPGGTYQTLDEQRERLSPAEERFERLRQTIGLFLGPIVFLALYLLPLPLPQDQQALAAVFSFVIIYWLTEPIPIPVTAVLALAMCILFGVAPADDVFGAFSSSTIFLFIGAFSIAEAMMRHGLDRRFAFRVLSIPGVSSSTYGVIIAFGAIAALLSAFISNTAAAAMLLPIGLGMMGALSGLVSDQSEGQTDPSRLRFGTALMLMIAYGASVGGLLTPIGSPPNLIGIGFIENQIGTTITFFQWTITALPIVLLMFIALCFILIALNRPEVRRISGAGEYVEEERRKLGGISAGERNTLVAFGVAVTLWILPGLVSLLLGHDSTPASFLRETLDEGVVAILAASLLFLLPVNWSERRFTLTWNEAVRIDWGTILLFGAGITLGSLLSQTGLARTIGHSQWPGGHELARGYDPRRGGCHTHLRDHLQHSERGDRRPDHHPHRQRRRSGAPGPGPCRDLRRLLRLHAPGLHAPERHRLRLRYDPHNQDGPLGRLLRHHRRHPHHGRRHLDGPGRRAGVSRER